MRNCLVKRVIAPQTRGKRSYLPIFTRKKDGSQCIIPSLQKLNQDVTCHHFKMDTLATALTLITKDCFMASLDRKDAYYAVPICEQHRKLLRFQWRGCLFQYSALPNGLASAPRLFTKLMKSVYASLRTKGHMSTAFLNDSLLVGITRERCMQDVLDSLETLQSLGFTCIPPGQCSNPLK